MTRFNKFKPAVWNLTGKRGGVPRGHAFFFFTRTRPQALRKQPLSLHLYYFLFIHIFTLPDCNELTCWFCWKPGGMWSRFPPLTLLNIRKNSNNILTKTHFKQSFDAADFLFVVFFFIIFSYDIPKRFLTKTFHTHTHTRTKNRQINKLIK